MISLKKGLSEYMFESVLPEYNILVWIKVACGLDVDIFIL